MANELANQGDTPKPPDTKPNGNEAEAEKKDVPGQDHVSALGRIQDAATQVAKAVGEKAAMVVVVATLAYSSPSTTHHEQTNKTSPGNENVPTLIAKPEVTVAVTETKGTEVTKGPSDSQEIGKQDDGNTPPQGPEELTKRKNEIEEAAPDVEEGERFWKNLEDGLPNKD